MWALNRWRINVYKNRASLEKSGLTPGVMVEYLSDLASEIEAEALKLVEEARKKADEILRNAQKRAEEILRDRSYEALLDEEKRRLEDYVEREVKNIISEAEERAKALKEKASAKIDLWARRLASIVSGVEVS
jgi:vacuolar-type H+-ATPase subunit H